MQKRVLGKTGELLSIVGFGGILVMDEEPSTAEKLVAKAIDAGINYFDVAPSYGNAEERLGPALEPYRKDVFLACKTGKRMADEAEAEFEASLERMRTDHFDLYQFHAVTTMEDVEQITGPGGALELFKRLRKEGRVRYLGLSAHSEEAGIALLDRFEFDSILYPINWVTWNEGGFGKALRDHAQSQGIGILALKALAKRQWHDEEEHKAWPKCWYRPVENYEEALMGLRFTLDQGVTAALTPGHAQFLDWAIQAAEDYAALTDAELVEIAERAKGLAPIFPMSN